MEATRRHARPGADLRFLEVSEDLLRLGYLVRFRAEGMSMHPTIRDGEMVTVEPVEPSKVKLGDIVLFRSKRGVTAHRLVGIERRSGARSRFFLRGDRMGACDDPVEAHQVLGKVILVERGKRTVDLARARTKALHFLLVFSARLKAWASSRLGGLSRLLRGSADGSGARGAGGVGP